MVTAENPSGVVNNPKTLDDSMSIWAHAVVDVEYKTVKTKGGDIIEFAAAVKNENEKLGTIRYGIGTKAMQEAIQRNNRIMIVMNIFIIIVIVIISFIFFLFFSRIAIRQAAAITKPLGELTQAAHTIASGDYTEPLKTVSDDEIGKLAQNFETMRQTVKQYTGNLENMVSERTAQLKEAQQELIEKAHQAGMADIATGTLHNVGNILNSVKTSTQVMSDLIHESQISSLTKANDLLRENMNNLEDFICNNPKGKKLLHYYQKLEEVFAAEREEMIKHIQRLNIKVDAIVEVIAAQQAYAGTSSLTEEFPLVDIIDDALTMQSGSIERYNITIVKNYNVQPRIPVQKVKLVHILINLINNAKEAMLQTPPDQRKLIITIDRDTTGAVIVKISDTGHGISRENLDRIFSHGFTTRKDGHGFGLHSSANYMTEMHGEMHAESEGINKGATFFLKFLPSAENKTVLINN